MSSEDGAKNSGFKGLTVDDISNLVGFFKGAVKRKFGIELETQLEDLFVTDVLVTLFFGSFSAAKSRLAITVLGSYYGEVLIDNLGGNWNFMGLGFDINEVNVVNVGPLKIYVNPMVTSYERLSRGFSRSLFKSFEYVAFRSGFDIEKKIRDMSVPLIRETLAKLDENGWTSTVISAVKDDQLPLSLRTDYAKVLGIMMEHLDNLKVKFLPLVEEMLASDISSEEGFERAIIGLAIIQYLSVPNLLPKILRFLTSKSDNVVKLKLQAIMALKNFGDDIVQDILEEAFENETDPVIRSFIAQQIGRFRNDRAFNYFKTKLEAADSPIDKLVLLSGVQVLGDPRFTPLLFKLLESEDDIIKEEVLKTFQYISLEPNDAERLAEFLNHENSSYRISAAYGIAYSQHPNKLELIKTIQNDPVESVRKQANRLLEILKFTDKPTFYYS